MVNQKAYHPRVRPIPTEVGCELTFEEATGVPLPSTTQFDRSQIVKRAIRVGLYDIMKKEFIANSAQVNVLYSGETAEDIWQFSTLKENGLNPILFKSASKDELVKPHIFMVFELVLYVRFGGSSIES